MKEIGYAFPDCDPDPMLDLDAMEAEFHAVQEQKHSHLCSMDGWDF